MNNKRVLIISHNPINTTDNMGKTIGNIFSKFKEDELCQLYFRNQNVEALNCQNFFCIDDVSMTKSVLNRFYKTGKEIKNHTIITEQKENTEEIFQYGRKRTGTIYILRNILWAIGKWNTKELKQWLNKTKPTCIFFVAGDYNFAFKISMKIAKRLNIPLYIYYTDEFYRKNLGENKLSNKLSKSMYRKVFKKAINEAKDYFTITENMLEFYEKEFNKPGKTLMNITEIKDIMPIDLNEQSRINIKYIGNLGYSRWKNIIKINNIINKVNEKNQTKFEFELYSGEKNQKVLNEIKNALGDKYKGSIERNMVMEKMKEAHILIHTENFEEIDKEKIKYSISTKIPDALAIQRVLLAYGPEDIASIEYIKKNNVGLIASSEKDLEEILNKIANKEIDTSVILKNAYELVEKNHRIDSIHNMLYKTIMGD